jgi:hypothetical protein
MNATSKNAMSLQSDFWMWLNKDGTSGEIDPNSAFDEP